MVFEQPAKQGSSLERRIIRAEAAVRAGAERNEREAMPVSRLLR